KPFLPSSFWTAPAEFRIGQTASATRLYSSPNFPPPSAARFLPPRQTPTRPLLLPISSVLTERRPDFVVQRTHAEAYATFLPQLLWPQRSCSYGSARYLRRASHIRLPELSPRARRVFSLPQTRACLVLSIPSSSASARQADLHNTDPRRQHKKRYPDETSRVI